MIKNNLKTCKMITIKNQIRQIEKNINNIPDWMLFETNKKYRALKNELKNYKKPAKMVFDLSKISNIEVENVDFRDAPDFVDAFITSADYDGLEMTEDQLNELSENYPDFCYEAIYDSIF